MRELCGAPRRPLALKLERLRPLLRAAVEGVRSRGLAPRQLPPRRELVAEREGLLVDTRRLARYLAATDGDRIPQFGGGTVLPPAFSVVWTGPMLWELLAKLGSFPVRGVIHLESELCCLRPLDGAGQIRCRVQVERLERSPDGLRIDALTRSWDAPGRLCVEDRSSFLLRYRTDEAGDASPSPAASDPEEAAPVEPADTGHDWTEVARWRLRSGQGRRYARASGDYNPIHLSALTARLFGYRRAILHGYCTQALVAHALIEHLFSGEPHRLRRLRIAFRRPLFLPAKPRLRIAAEGAAVRIFELLAADGLLYADGEFTGG